MVGLAAAILLVSSVNAGEPAKRLPLPASPLSPAEALKHFQLDPACRIELVAAEPEVVDPVDVRFDEDGRMWVVEMRDYPHGPAKGEPGTCRIKVLEDRDGDGRFETATVFADKLLFATGIQPWRGGVFVTLAGRVAYMKDTNGDGRADIDETWFTGFAQENSQLRANHPRLALDNHIYVANGLRGGKIVDARKPGSKPIDISGMDFRFDPLATVGGESFRRKDGKPKDSPDTTDRRQESPATVSCEAVSGNGQFGLTFDDYGNRFVCSNRNPLRHVVLEQRYLKQNPLVAVPDVCQDVAKPAEQSRVFPISRAWTTSNLHAGQFTAACGVEIYRGDALPKEFYGNAFTCEPTGNLVHREIMKPAGATFTSEPAYKDREFLASTDEWFRPVNLTLGPDGALYVVDMYRAVIEHPDFMPDELKKRPDLLAGNDRGRIWRIAAKDRSGDPPPSSGRRKPADERRPQLSKAKSEDLVKLLEHPNAWSRETAQRLLVERQDGSMSKRLEELALDMTRASTVRNHALWILRGHGSLSPDILVATLRNADPRVREQSAILAEGIVDKIVQRLGPDMAIDAPRDERRLGFQFLLTNSYGLTCSMDADESFRDHWTRVALVISIQRNARSYMQGLVDSRWARAVDPDEDFVTLMTELGKQVDPTTLSGVFRAMPRMGSLRLQFAVMQSLAQSMLRRGTTLASEIDKLRDSEARHDARTIFQRAFEIADKQGITSRSREEAIDLLAHSTEGADILFELCVHEPSQSLRLRAMAALSRHAPAKRWQSLLERFSTETPAVRRALAEGALNHADRATVLLDELSAGRIKPAELDRAHVDRLLKHSDAKIRERAAKVLADAVPADRQKVLAEYQVVLKMAGDARRGSESFKKNCATCHRIGEMGVNVAPDISDSRVKTPAQLLTDILQPNRAIDANYVSYSLLTTDGRQLTGIIAAETATSVTLKQQEGKTTTLLRSEIEKLQSNGISLMPEGLEKTIPPQEMADVIAFIKNWRYLDGRTPLGR